MFQSVNGYRVCLYLSEGHGCVCGCGCKRCVSVTLTVSVHLQVFSMFLETLVDFIGVHKDDLQDWLFVLLTQLLKKMGADLLGSVQAKVQKALDVTRWVHFKPFVSKHRHI